MQELNTWIAKCLNDMARRELAAGDSTTGGRLYALALRPWQWPLGIEEKLMQCGYRPTDPTWRPESFRYVSRHGPQLICQYASRGDGH